MTARELAAAVAATYHAWMQTVEAARSTLAEHDLTAATFQALWLIDPGAPPPSMKVMAERLYCNASNLTFITNQLIERGLIERTVDPHDRRSRVLTLTVRGRQVREQVTQAAMAQSPLAMLTSAQQQQLTALLTSAFGRT
ncbi:MarR family winged helix-turn-helix transcriptional regulator [Actinophytocola xanthii]|uniref:MarR family transcriptional regulator n=1 Tax=Actinophytocola xanthii TaxID=1912961 RepID=A0A1Q8CTJ5_9PSEU|nr:MarR family transcriptional regulator [Actinophytocola xanthii]OLF17691.1 MarR family transcriptional regulator [Actinophytocola xanthii]